MWVEDLPNGKYKYCERYTDTKGKIRKKVSVTLDKNSSRAQNEASRLLYNKEVQVMKRLGYLSAFKNLKKLDIKRPNCWEMLV